MKQKLMIFLAVFSAVFAAFSTEYYVDASRPNDSGDGTTWSTAKQTIQAAIDLTVDGDIVWVTNGVYSIGGTATPGGFLMNRVCITNRIFLFSMNGPELTKIKGARGTGSGMFEGPLSDDAVRGMFLKEGCVVSGFSIEGGYTALSGGILNYAGGGVFMEGVCMVSNCILSGNSAGNGGGGCFYSGGELISSVVSNNFSFSGGGLVVADGRLEGCLFVSNHSNGRGGAAGINGSAVVNCTFVQNTADENGGGVSLRDSTMDDSILWGNDAPFDANIDNQNTTIQNVCSPDGITCGMNGNITNAPLFVDAANGDFRLMSNSPCINWGDNSVVTNAYDLDGNPRIVEGVVDMGAYEYQGIFGLADSDGDGLDDDWERAHGGNQNPEQTCSNGVNTVRQAYIAGLDPKDSNSRFRSSVHRSLAAQNVLQWQGVSGRVYAVYYSTNLLNGFLPLETNIAWSAGCFTDSVYNAQGQMYYRIDVQLEDESDSGDGSSSGGGSVGPSDPFDPGSGDWGETPPTGI